MSTAVATDARTELMRTTYSISDEKIAELKEKLLPLQCDSNGGYEMVRQGIATVRDLRTGVEKTRKKLKEDSLEWGRKVDTEAKRLTAMLLEIETPLVSRKEAVDAENERIKREKAAEIQRKIDEAAAVRRAAEEAKLRADREAEEARIRAEREAEEARLKAEADRLAEERRKLEAERAAQEEAARIERERLESERRAAEAERQRLAKIESDRLAAIRAEQDAKDKAERERVEAEQRAEREKLAAERAALEAERKRIADEEAQRQAVLRAEQEERDRIERERLEAEARTKREAELAARREAMRPDIEKLRSWAAQINQVPLPQFASIDVTYEAKNVAEAIDNALMQLIDRLAA